jgi:aspartyl protease family protein
VGHGAAATVHSPAVGPIRMTNVLVEINKAPMGASLLGMPFLKRLDSFEVRGDQLFLRAR